MSGEPDPRYIQARRVLLDALVALEPQLDSIILMGAQAIYLHAGEGDLAVAPFTTDADLALDIDLLADDPRLEDAMKHAEFQPSDQPGSWVGKGGVSIDLIVAEAQAGGGTRGARIPPHDKRAARKALGLEGALIDKDRRPIVALDPSDTRSFAINVAGPAALLISKVIKIEERKATPKRLKNKDALDVLRLLRAIGAGDIAERMLRITADGRAKGVAVRALTALRDLFGSRDGLGCAMTIEATQGLENPEVIAGSVVALVQEVLDACERSRT